jgi:hypothetical protein
VTSSGDFSLASALRAAEEDALDRWVVDFLASPGSDNAELAASLALRGVVYLGPLRFELDRLTPMAGPDEGRVAVPVPEEVWETDVEAMEHSLEEGWHPPPLLVSHRDGAYFLEDGNHRCETLRRNGATHAWCILVFADEAARAKYLEQHGQTCARPASDRAAAPRASGASESSL